MSETREWPRIAVVGAGAVGGYFGGMFARAGAPTVFIGRKHFADAVNSNGLILDKSAGQERIRAKATVEMSAVRDCSLNAIAALGHARYGQIAQDTDAKQLMQDIVDEVLAVARAARIVLPGTDDRESGMAAAMEIATQMADAFSSTAQDLSRGRPTEIDALNGYIARRGAELGVPVPMNHALFTLVKLAEQKGSI